MSRAVPYFIEHVVKATDPEPVQRVFGCGTHLIFSTKGRWRRFPPEEIGAGEWALAKVGEACEVRRYAPDAHVHWVGRLHGVGWEPREYRARFDRWTAAAKGEAAR